MQEATNGRNWAVYVGQNHDFIAVAVAGVRLKSRMSGLTTRQSAHSPEVPPPETLNGP